jgi:hypothetical protein
VAIDPASDAADGRDDFFCAPDDQQMPAIELQIRLRQLHAERVLASTAGLAADAAYMADLDDEIAEVIAAYAGAAVTEIATLRAELLGRQVG